MNVQTADRDMTYLWYGGCIIAIAVEVCFLYNKTFVA